MTRVIYHLMMTRLMFSCEKKIEYFYICCNHQKFDCLIACSLEWHQFWTKGQVPRSRIKWDYCLSCFALDQPCCCRNTTSGKSGKLNSSSQLQFLAFWKWIYCHIVEGSSPIQECLELSWSTNLPAWTYVQLLEEHDTRFMEMPLLLNKH